MTCQDCIHHSVCYYAGRLKTKDSDGEKRIIAETNNVEDTCENFQDQPLKQLTDGAENNNNNKTE